MDGDDVFDEALEQQWEHMKLSGYSEEQISQAKQRKKFKEVKHGNELLLLFFSSNLMHLELIYSYAFS
jgi:hypothetical protein